MGSPMSIEVYTPIDSCTWVSSSVHTVIGRVRYGEVWCRSKCKDGACRCMKVRSSVKALVYRRDKTEGI